MLKGRWRVWVPFRQENLARRHLNWGLKSGCLLIVVSWGVKSKVSSITDTRPCAASNFCFVIALFSEMLLKNRRNPRGVFLVLLGHSCPEQLNILLRWDSTRRILQFLHLRHEPIAGIRESQNQQISRPRLNGVGSLNRCFAQKHRVRQIGPGSPFSTHDPPPDS